LLALRDDCGKPVVRLALPREKAYQGEFAADGPDIALLAHEGFYFAEGIERPVLRPNGTKNTEKSGNHQINGIVGVYGPGVRAGVELADAKIIDVAPTVLHLLGLPVQQDMDGRALEEALAPEYLAARPVAYDQAKIDVASDDYDYTDDDRGQIEARL